jgi:exonuclease III
VNVNGLKSPTKKVSWIKKQNSIICCLQDIDLTDKDKHWLKEKEWRKYSKKVDSQSRQE